MTLKAICGKYRISTKQCLKRFYFDHRLGVSPQKRLARFADTKMWVYCRAPEPYQPGGENDYSDERELEVGYYLRERNRPGSEDMKWLALRRDHYHCCRCGNQVSAQTSQLDHIRPVNCFASFEQANSIDNVQTLCLPCHKLKTRTENRRA